MKWNNFKGMSLTDLQNAGLLMVFVGVAVGVGIYLNNQIADTSFDRTNVVLEQLTWVNNASYMKTAYPYIYSVNAIHNGTVPTTANTYTSGNYSFLNDGSGVKCCGVCGTITCNTNTTLWINYTTWAGEDYKISKNASSGLRNIATWIPIIAVVVAASAVIGVLGSAFLNRRSEM